MEDTPVPDALRGCFLADYCLQRPLSVLARGKQTLQLRKDSHGKLAYLIPSRRVCRLSLPSRITRCEEFGRFRKPPSDGLYAIEMETGATLVLPFWKGHLLHVCFLELRVFVQ